MPRTIKFHLDENVGHSIAVALRREGIDVTTSTQAALNGADDPTQLAHATAQGRVLITHDRDHLRLHHQGVAHAGIVYNRQGSRSPGEIVGGILLIWDVLDPDDMVNQVEYL